MVLKNKKIKYGQFYTKENFWLMSEIKSLIVGETIIDPFAGGGDLLVPFQETHKAIGFDVDPDTGWKFNDSIDNIPFIKNGFIVTNPPYLSKSSAKRKGYKNINFKNQDNLYKASLETMINSNMPGIAIIPETFIHSKFNMDYIHKIFVIIPNPFSDTEIPVCVVYFNKNTKSDDVDIYINNGYEGKLKEMKKNLELMLLPKNNLEISFKRKESDITFISFDSTKDQNKIRFENSNGSILKTSSRLKNPIYINTKSNKELLKKLNAKIQLVRKKYEILIPPFNGNTKNGDRRRRMTFTMAKKIIRSIEC